MDRGIFFDEDYRIRLLEVDKFAASKSLQDNCGSFVENIQRLQDLVQKYVGAVDVQVDKIETEKLKAVGLRNKVAALNEERRAKEKELGALLAEKQEELARLGVEEQSLAKMKQEQDLLIAKLSDASAGAPF